MRWTLESLSRVGCEFVRPLTSRLPRGGLRLIRLLGGDRDDLWKASPERVVHDRWIGAQFCVELSEWTGRWHYFSGRYYDVAHFLLLRQQLQPGDTYLDVGANRGVHSVSAATVVGPSGRVICVENPATVTVLRCHLEMNGVTNALVLPVGLDSVLAS